MAALRSTRARQLLLLGVVVGAASGKATPDDAHHNQREKEIREHYESTKRRCTHGQAGVIVLLADGSSRTPEALGDHISSMGKSKGRADDRLHHVFSSPHTIRGISAHLSNVSLDELFSEHHLHEISAVHADCIVSLRNRLTLENRNQTHPPPRGKGETTLLGDGPETSALSDGEQVLETLSAGQESVGAMDLWGLDRSDGAGPADGVYNFGKATGEGTTLYQIDTGVVHAHTEFATYDEHGRVNGNKILHSMSMGCTDPVAQVEECNTLWTYKGDVGDAELLRRNKIPADDGISEPTLTPPGAGCDAHGTHTASTVVGNKFGAAKKAGLVVIQGLSCIATAQDSIVVRALEWVVHHANAQKPFRPAVVLLSLGGEKDTVLNTAVKRTVEHGVHVVVAAGNDHSDACTSSPSAVVNAETVAAVNSELVVSAFSSYGRCVDIVAPGENIVGAYAALHSNSSTRILSGTSMAAPHVAGAMLQALQLFPHMRPNQTKQLLSCVSTRGLVRGDEQVVRGETPNELLRMGEALSAPERMREVIRESFSPAHKRFQKLPSGEASRTVRSSQYRAGTSALNVDAAGAAQNNMRHCLALVDHLEATRPNGGVLMATLDKDTESVIIPDEDAAPSPPPGVLDDRPFSALSANARTDKIGTRQAPLVQTQL